MAPLAIAGIVTALGAGAKIAGGVIDAAAQEKQGDAQSKAYEYNAQIKEKQARQVLDQTADDEASFRVMTRKELGSETANYSATGITKDGSPLDVLADSASRAEHDALNLRRKGELQAQGLRDDASMDRLTGQNIKDATRFSVGKVLLGGVSAAASAVDSIASRSASAPKRSA